MGHVATAADPKQIRRWLETCERNHGPTCNLGTFATARYRRPMELTLIDVHNNCLVELSSDSRYVALSYVWGATAMCTALKSNFINLHKRGSLAGSTDLPTVVQDAMHLVASLGERYLWVDRLCIVQDASTKHQHLARMDVIFTHALLTIAAVDGLDANSALPGVRYGSRLPVLKNERLKERTCISEPPSLHSVLQDSVYESRGWTLQERALSRRVLYISDQQVYFQCNVSIRSESHTKEKTRKGVKYANWTIGQRLNEIRLKGSLAEVAVTSLLPTIEITRDYWLLELPTYQDLVQVYSARNLTYPSDILNAFAGFSSVFEDCCGGPIIHGLPLRVLSVALLWCQAKDENGGQRRRGSNGHLMPSWSWAGWQGPIKYPSLIRAADHSQQVSLSLFSRLEDIEICIESNDLTTQKEQDYSQINPPLISIISSLSRDRRRKTNTLRFSAPTAPCTQFDFEKEARFGASEHSVIYRNGDPCGVVLSKLELNDLKSHTGVLFVLVSHDFNQFRRAQLRSTYRVPEPGLEQRSSNPHTVNLLVVKDMGGYYERIAVAKMYSEAWPRGEKASDQIKMITLA